MRTVHIVLPANKPFGGMYEFDQTIAYARYLITSSRLNGFDTHVYGAEPLENEPIHVLVDTAERWRLNAQDTEWPPLNDITAELHSRFNRLAIENIRKHLSDDNYILLLGGISQKSIAEAIKESNPISVHSDNHSAFLPLSIYPSYAAMHANYAVRNKPPSYADCVLRYCPPIDHKKRDNKLGGIVTIGFTDVQSIQIAHDMATATGLANIRIDLNDPKWKINEYYDLLANASCLIQASSQLDTVGRHVIDALSHGTTVITTDWGAPAEVIKHGLNGYRCRSYGEYLQAISLLPDISPTTVKYHFDQALSITLGAARFSDYLDQVADTWNGGFYSKRHPISKRYD